MILHGDVIPAEITDLPFLRGTEGREVSESESLEIEMIPSQIFLRFRQDEEVFVGVDRVET